ncbi:MAG: chromosome segregation SMC family protein [Sphaerochaetaceae bacterium]
MFLKSLELFGFKSFADKTRLEFADGTTSLLGPNGCGKSNIVDAIKWVLGEQSTKTLRAGKMEDVIFNGTESRKPLNVAEVTLVVGNEEGLLPIEHVEVEIKRRLFRSGENEFFINRNQVRLKDVRELFFDTGVGKSAYSILEQGKIDQILSNKPEDRRYIFEEAAGITRYKLKSLEATRKLERTQENIEQVETLLSEVKRQYDSRKIQAAKAERYRELEKERSAIEVDVQLSNVKTLMLLRDTRQEELHKSQEEYDQLNEGIKDSSYQIETQQTEMRQHTDLRFNIQTRLQRLDEQQNSKRDNLVLLQQWFRDFSRSKDEAVSRSAQISERISRDREGVEDQRDHIDVINGRITSLNEEILRNETAMAGIQRLMVDHENGIEDKEQQIIKAENDQKDFALQLQALTDAIVSQLDEKLERSGYSGTMRKKAESDFLEKLQRCIGQLSEQRSYAAQLAGMVRNRAVELPAAIAQWDRVLSDIGASFTSLETLFNTYCHTIPDFIDEFLAPEGIITHKHQIDGSMEAARQKIASNRAEIQVLREENKHLAQQLEQHREQSLQLKVMLGDFSAQAKSSKSLIENLERSLTEQQYLLGDAEREAQLAQERVEEAVAQMANVKDEQQRIADEIEHMQGQLSDVLAVIEEANVRISSQRMELNERYEQLNRLRTATDKYAFHIETINGQIQDVYMNYYDTNGKSLKEFEGRLTAGELDDLPALRERLTEIKKQIQGMGYINHMASEEFAEIKDRYNFLVKQMGDLEKAKNDLTRVIDEITKRSEELFIDSYNRIRVNFQEMFHRMFGGGRAELKLLEPDNVLESGIDILAQPPGKKLDRLAPLSGGEKSLTAVALLFATYKVKPSPFCILDEIDAALDDRNIGFFLNVLEDFSKKSQFIIITHNKHTVMGSSTLLGVTMQERGVSKAVSYRLGMDADKAAIYSEQVDMDSDNKV